MEPLDKIIKELSGLSTKQLEEVLAFVKKQKAEHDGRKGKSLC